MIWSHSKFNTFEICPKKFEFAYIIRTKSEFVGPELILGQAVHKTLQYLYGEVMRGGCLEIEEILALYWGLWESAWRNEQVVIVNKKKREEDYQHSGERMLVAYYERHSPFEDGTVEVELSVPFKLGKYEAITVMDRVSIEEGVPRIHDYKTGKDRPSPRRRIDQQRAIYQMAYEQVFGQVARTVWHYLACDLSDEECYSAAELQWTLDRILAEIGEIERAQREADFPTRRGRLCDWCGFRVFCPAWQTTKAEEEI